MSFCRSIGWSYCLSRRFSIRWSFRRCWSIGWCYCWCSGICCSHTSSWCWSWGFVYSTTIVSINLSTIYSCHKFSSIVITSNTLPISINCSCCPSYSTIRTSIDLSTIYNCRNFSSITIASNIIPKSRTFGCYPISSSIYASIYLSGDCSALKYCYCFDTIVAHRHCSATYCISS